jgi:hypothetical protein
MRFILPLAALALITSVGSALFWSPLPSRLELPWNLTGVGGPSIDRCDLTAPCPSQWCRVDPITCKFEPWTLEER